MFTRHILPIGLAVLAGTTACTFTESRPPRPVDLGSEATPMPHVPDEEGAESADSNAPAGSVAEAVTPTEPPPPPRIIPRRSYGMADEELSIWRDPEFKRRFVESYMAESDIEPGITIVERELMEEILELISADQMEEALMRLDDERGPAASAVYDFTAANIHFQNEELDEAAAAYDIAVEKYPKFRRAWKNLALIHVRRGDFIRATEAFTRVVELGGNDAITYGLLGYCYGNLEDSLSAETAYRMAIVLDPETMDWKMGLARAFFKQERFADAVALCKILIEDQPERADLWLLQANAFIGLGEPLRAAENYELVDRLGKATPDSMNMLGDIYINEELYDLAVTSYIRAMEADLEADTERPIRAAKVLTARGALDETARLVERIEELHGDQLETDDRKDLLKLRARLAVAAGAGDEEARVLEEIVELDPLDGEALILLGQHSNRSGDAEKAVFWYERAASIEAYEADAKVRHAQLLVGQGKYGEALPLLRRAQLIKPRDNIQEYLEQVERVSNQRGG